MTTPDVLDTALDSDQFIEPRKVWVVVDTGCHECGVSSEPVGIFWTEGEAVAAAGARDVETKGWRDGGQTFCEVFEMPLPTGAP